MIDVSVERGAKRAFAAAVDWPGWCRAGRTADAALAALGDYAARYAPVAARAGFDLPLADFVVVEEVPGDSTTDFGAPSVLRPSDRRALSTAEAARFGTLLRACWGALDDVAAGAPVELRPGPRGGGRNRDKMLGHVLGAEAMYATKLGLRLKEPAVGDREAIAAARDALMGVLGVASDGSPLKERGWTPRQAIRRIAWHVLDHAWEMQDRATP